MSNGVRTTVSTEPPARVPAGAVRSAASAGPLDAVHPWPFECGPYGAQTTAGFPNGVTKAETAVPAIEAIRRRDVFWSGADQCATAQRSSHLFGDGRAQRREVIGYALRSCPAKLAPPSCLEQLARPHWSQNRSRSRKRIGSLSRTCPRRRSCRRAAPGQCRGGIDAFSRMSAGRSSGRRSAESRQHLGGSASICSS